MDNVVDGVDYCTLWPDTIFGLDLRACCAAHDLVPNSWESNFELFLCVGQQNWLMAAIMFAGLSTLGWLYVWTKRKNRKE